MHNIKHAHGAGLCTPKSDEAPTGDTVRGFKGEDQSDSADCAAFDADRKAIAIAKAQAARAGCSLNELACGGFLVCCCGMSKELPCIRAVGALLRRIGGAK
jgi:hypothetical protein